MKCKRPFRFLAKGQRYPRCGALGHYCLPGAVCFLILALPVSQCLRSCFEYRICFIFSSSRTVCVILKAVHVHHKNVPSAEKIKKQEHPRPHLRLLVLKCCLLAIPISILSYFFAFDFLYIFDVVESHCIFHSCILFSSPDIVS